MTSIMLTVKVQLWIAETPNDLIVYFSGWTKVAYPSAMAISHVEVALSHHVTKFTKCQ